MRHKRKHVILWILLYFWTALQLSSSDAAPIRLPSKRECIVFAEAGSCVTSDRFMTQYCGSACIQHFRRQRLERLQPPPIADSFYDLAANDIDGNSVGFSQFHGKVTVIVNVASECGYTEEHYDEMVKLYNALFSTGKFELVAFPCNQFDEQEPGSPEEIKAFTKEKGVTFRIMEKIDVNGRNTHDVYRYLKNIAGPDKIEWNFSTYYVIDAQGGVESFSDVTPLELHDTLVELLEE